MAKHSGISGKRNAVKSFAKQGGTVAEEHNASQKKNKESNSIKDMFKKQSDRLLKKRPVALFVKPQSQSTPRRGFYKNSKEHSEDTDCEILVEDVTPIKENRRRSLGNYIEKLEERVEKRQCKSDGNFNTEDLQMLSSEQLLSADETLLGAVNLDCIEAKESAPVVENPTSNSSYISDVFLEENEHYASACIPRATRSNFKIPELPVRKKSGSQTLQSSSTAHIVHAEIHTTDIDDVDWSNDSMLERAIGSDSCPNSGLVRTENSQRSLGNTGRVRVIPNSRLMHNNGSGYNASVLVNQDDTDLLRRPLQNLCENRILPARNKENCINLASGSHSKFAEKEGMSSRSQTHKELLTGFVVSTLNGSEVTRPEQNNLGAVTQECKNESKKSLTCSGNNGIKRTLIEDETCLTSKTVGCERNENASGSTLVEDDGPITSSSSHSKPVTQEMLKDGLGSSAERSLTGRKLKRRKLFAPSDNNSVFVNDGCAEFSSTISSTPQHSVCQREVHSRTTSEENSGVSDDQLHQQARYKNTSQSNPMEIMNEKCLTSPIKTASNLSVSERNQRMLMTNAQKPISSKRKCSDVSHPQTETVTSEPDHNLGPYFGLPLEVKILIEKWKGITDLYDWQKECLNLPAVNLRTNLVYALPTSGGKTLVAEILMLRELLCHKKNAIFILPYVAIVQEKVHSLSPFAVALNFLVEEYAGGKGCYPPKKRRRKLSVYVATIEKAHSLINSLIETKRLSELGLVVVDELHLIGEKGGRGATLECLLTKLLYFPAQKVHIVGMSATIGNIAEIAKFLQAEIYLNNFRPVELKEFVKDERGLWSVNPQKENEEFLILEREVLTDYTPQMMKLDPDKIAALVMEVSPENSCLVFCASKKSCENVACMIVKNMPPDVLKEKKEKKIALVEALMSQGRGTMCSILKMCIPSGVAYHHSGLTADERRLLEEAFRAKTLCCICCTSTLAAGVNLPAKRVILRAPYVGREFISLSQYKQMVGRAGRAGLDLAGESILVCKQQDMPQVVALLQSEMDTANSSLHICVERGLQALILSCIGLDIASTRSELHKMAACTLLNVQAEKLKVNVNKLVNTAVQNLFQLKAVTVDKTSSPVACSTVLDTDACNVSFLNIRQGNLSKRFVLGRDTRLKISQLGKAAMKGSIDLPKANQLYRDLVGAQASLVLLSHLHLLYVVTPYEMVDEIKYDPEVYFNAFSSLNRRDLQAARVIGITEGSILSVLRGQRNTKVPQSVLKRFYLTLVLNDLWSNMNVWDVSEKFALPRGLIQQLMQQAATFASCVMRFCEEFDEFWAFKELLKSFAQRLSHCCTAELLQLMELPAVKTGRARQLYNAGYKTLKDVANSDVSALVRSVDHLPRRVASQIKSAATLLLLEKAESLKEEAEEVLEGLMMDSVLEGDSF